LNAFRSLFQAWAVFDAAEDMACGSDACKPIGKVLEAGQMHLLAVRRRGICSEEDAAVPVEGVPRRGLAAQVGHDL